MGVIKGVVKDSRNNKGKIDEWRIGVWSEPQNKPPQNKQHETAITIASKVSKHIINQYHSFLII